jgi:4,5-DOPA dioxygenase extradiol
VALRAAALLRQAGFVVTANGCRGLDHGAWVPLLHMFPQADVPVAQVSVQPTLAAAHHLRLGAALAPLAAEGVLVIGSGHMTHNLGEWMHNQGAGRAIAEGGAVAYVEEFRRWVDQRLRENDRAALTRFTELAPHARRAHPTPEHFLPLFVALGAAGDKARAERLDAGVDSGVLAMDAYLFWPQ